jgi:hypothetical protein
MPASVEAHRLQHGSDAGTYIAGRLGVVAHPRGNHHLTASLELGPAIKVAWSKRAGSIRSVAFAEPMLTHHAARPEHTDEPISTICPPDPLRTFLQLQSPVPPGIWHHPRPVLTAPYVTTDDAVQLITAGR